MIALSCLNYLTFSNGLSRLAKNLYTIKARFIFELLQNADDNNYTNATASGSLPFVSFHVYPRLIVLDCNQDGFTDADLAAICSIGKSSKGGAQEYIGEKGIGFKSVFMAAWKVNIQSGAFSFSFTHRPGESGMGMISPVWEDTQEELEHPLTRITLHLHDTGDKESLAKTRGSIEEQFRGLQETFLLFMKNLRVIHVSFYNDNGDLEQSASYTIDRPRRNFAVLKRVSTHGDTIKEDVKQFHITTHEATNLARNDNREYSATEESTQAYSKSQVVLAFPLSETDVPLIARQDIFAFLPVRPVGFKFLIQADFVTDASRQDIVKDSPRNRGLHIGIADAFAKAVLQFCKHRSLRYRWIRYLPDTKDESFDSFWRSLVRKISASVCSMPAIYCHKKNDLHLIRDLVRLPSDLYENDQPLLDDGDAEDIISQHYVQADLNILEGYGLRYASFHEVTEWVRQDLRRSDSSQMKSPKTTESWHTQVAKLLHHPFRQESHEWKPVCEELKRLDLLPLEDGTWASTTTGPVYFAQVEGIHVDIPSSVNLRIISKRVSNVHRLRLFKDMGTKSAPVAVVRNAILEIYSENGDPTDLPLQTSRAHLEFLYLTQHLMGEDEPTYERLSIHGYQCGQPTINRPYRECMYIANEDDPYGPWELFKETSPGPGPGDGAPGYDGANFVNGEYFGTNPKTTSQQQLTWVEWFYEYLYVEIHFSFSSNNSTSWEDAAEYLRNERPEKFLGALRIHYQHHPEPDNDFIQCVQNTEVLCRGNHRISMREAYFPTQMLERLVEQYVEPGVVFPWLWLDEEATYDAIPPGWTEMLTKYGVGSAEDVDFALNMLQYSVDALPADADIAPSSRTRLFGLYDHIQTRYRAAGNNRMAVRDKIR